MDDLISRAAMLLGAGCEEATTACVLMDTGVSSEDAFLAVKAGVILNRIFP